MIHSTNLGFPIIFYRFKQKAYSDEFGKTLPLKIGLYYGGQVSYENSSRNLKISPFLAIVPSKGINNNDFVLKNNEYRAIIKTTTDITISYNTLRGNLGLNYDNEIYTIYIYLVYNYDRNEVSSNTYNLYIDTSPNNDPYYNTVYISKFKVKFNVDKNNDPIIEYFNEIEKSYGSFYVQDESSTNYYFIQNLQKFAINSNEILINNEKLPYNEPKIEKSYKIHNFDLNDTSIQIDNNCRLLCNDNIMIFNFKVLKNVYLAIRKLYTSGIFASYNNIVDDLDTTYVDDNVNYILTIFDNLNDKNILDPTYNNMFLIKLDTIFGGDSSKIDRFYKYLFHLNENVFVREMIYKKDYQIEKPIVIRNLISKFEYVSIPNTFANCSVYTYNF